MLVTKYYIINLILLSCTYLIDLFLSIIWSPGLVLCVYVRVWCLHCCTNKPLNKKKLPVWDPESRSVLRMCEPYFLFRHRHSLRAVRDDVTPRPEHPPPRTSLSFVQLFCQRNVYAEFHLERGSKTQRWPAGWVDLQRVLETRDESTSKGKHGTTQLTFA